MKTLSEKVFILIFIVSIHLMGQWSQNPALNLQVCDLNGEQVLAKMVSLPDGGCYVSWFDTRNGSYNVFLQKLSPLGNKLWQPNGLLISNHPQEAWLTDYDLIADVNNNAILVFSDIRTGPNLQKPVAYKINPSGEFLWGPNGIDISTPDEFQSSPKAVELSDGNIAFAWMTSGTLTGIALQKVSPAGVKLWNNPIIISGTEQNYDYPSLIKSDNGSFILIHNLRGATMFSPCKIKAQKIASDGTKQWGENGIAIQDNGTMQFFYSPEVISDKNNGAIIVWIDDRDGNQLSSVFLQRVSSTGILSFAIDGIEASTSISGNKFLPTISFDAAVSECYIFWRDTDPDQNWDGISGQRISSTGERLWGSSGKVIIPVVPQSTNTIRNLVSHYGDSKTFTFFIEDSANVMPAIKGFALDNNGNFVWNGNFITLSNRTQDKLQMVSVIDQFNNMKFAWSDKRLDESGIYAQDINTYGQLGQSGVPVELSSFSADILNGFVSLKWITSSETNNYGFYIEKKETSVWNEIGFIKGAGTSVKTTNYSFSDKIALTQDVQYRLKQVDFDGTVKYSENLAVSFEKELDFNLSQNFPNPFNPSTTISYSIPFNNYIRLELYNMMGEKIADLLNEFQTAGYHQYRFSTQDYQLTSGIYYYRLVSGDYFSIKKMILLK